MGYWQLRPGATMPCSPGNLPEFIQNDKNNHLLNEWINKLITKSTLQSAIVRFKNATAVFSVDYQ